MKPVNRMTRLAEPAVPQEGSLSCEVEVPSLAVDLVLKRRIPTDLGETAAEKLRDDIVTMRLRPSTRLVEAALAAEMGMSRGPIRDALAVLIRERLVERDQRGGAFVRGLTKEDIREIFALRELLETYAAQRAITLMSEQDVKELAHTVDYMEWMAEREDYSALGEIDLAFHEALVASAGMARLGEMWALLKGPMKAIIKMTDALTADIPRHVVKAHRPIVEALSARDEQALAEAVCAHCEHTERVLLEALDGLGGSESPLSAGERENG